MNSLPLVKVRTKPISDELAATLRPRIMSRVDIDADGCWIRNTAINPNTGYSSIQIRRDGRAEYYLAHRVMHTADNGQIPDGYTIDHLCEVRACCNPAHLVAVPHRDNVLRSQTNPSAINARKATCNLGHALMDTAAGKRRCKTCLSIHARERRQKRRLAGVPEGVPHGSAKAYQYYACLCDVCRDGQRQRYMNSKAGVI